MSKQLLERPAALGASAAVHTGVVLLVNPSLSTPLLASVAHPVGLGSAVAAMAGAAFLTFRAKARFAEQSRVPVDAMVVAPLLVLTSAGVAFAASRLAALTIPPLLALVLGGGVSAVTLARVYVLWTRVPTAQLPQAHAREVWWAEIPFEEGQGSKDRPCVVVASSGRRVTVLMCTSKDKSGRHGYVPTPQGVFRPGSRSWIRTDRHISIDRSELRRRQAVIDEPTWRRLDLGV